MFGFFVYRHINLLELFNAEVVTLERQKGLFLIQSSGNNGAQIFPNGISPKGNIVLLESELTYYDDVVQHITHNAKEAPLYIYI